MQRWRSGQTHLTVNQAPSGYTGSNPVLCILESAPNYLCKKTMTGNGLPLPATETQWDETNGAVKIEAGEVWTGVLVRVTDGRCFEVTKIETSEDNPPFLTGKQLLPEGEHMTFFNEISDKETGFSSDLVVKIAPVRYWL